MGEAKPIRRAVTGFGADGRPTTVIDDTVPPPVAYRDYPGAAMAPI